MSDDLVLVEPPDIAHTALAPRAALVLPRLTEALPDSESATSVFVWRGRSIRSCVFAS